MKTDVNLLIFSALAPLQRKRNRVSGAIVKETEMEMKKPIPLILRQKCVSPGKRTDVPCI